MSVEEKRFEQDSVKIITQLYNDHATSIFNTVYRLVNHTAEAEDILQESFVTAYQKINSFGQRSSLKTWVTKIAINKALDVLRSKKIQWVDMDIPDTNDDKEIDEEEFEYRVEEVKRAISLLPTGYRAVASLYLIDDIPQEEIGQLLGITHSTVRTQYKKAKAKIIQIIKNDRRYQ